MFVYSLLHAGLREGPILCFGLAASRYVLLLLATATVLHYIRTADNDTVLPAQFGLRDRVPFVPEAKQAKQG